MVEESDAVPVAMWPPHTGSMETNAPHQTSSDNGANQDSGIAVCTAREGELFTWKTDRNLRNASIQAKRSPTAGDQLHLDTTSQETTVPSMDLSNAGSLQLSFDCSSTSFELRGRLGLEPEDDTDKVHFKAKSNNCTWASCSQDGHIVNRTGGAKICELQIRCKAHEWGYSRVQMCDGKHWDILGQKISVRAPTRKARLGAKTGHFCKSCRDQT